MLFDLFLFVFEIKLMILFGVLFVVVEVELLWIDLIFCIVEFKCMKIFVLLKVILLNCIIGKLFFCSCKNLVLFDVIGKLCIVIFVLFLLFVDFEWIFGIVLNVFVVECGVDILIFVNVILLIDEFDVIIVVWCGIFVIMIVLRLFFLVFVGCVCFLVCKFWFIVSVSVFNV